MKTFLRLLRCVTPFALLAVVIAAGFMRITTIASVPYKTSGVSTELRLICPGSVLGVGVQASGLSFNALGRPSLLHVASQSGLTSTQAELNTGSQSADSITHSSSGGQAESTRPEAANLNSVESNRLSADTSNTRSVSPLQPPGVILRGDLNTAGSQIQDVTSDRIRGLAATTCQRPSLDAWFVGGATGISDTTLALVGNPSDSSTGVAITVYSADGQKLTSGVALPKKSLRAVNLTGIAPGLASLAVHIKSDSVPVYSVLQHSVTKGAVTQGVSYITSIAPSTTQYISGVTITERTVSDNDTPQILLRLFAPDKNDADVSISVVSDTSPGTAMTAHVTGGSIKDVMISGLTPASYFLSITSSVRIIASALSTMAVQQLATTTGQPGPHDFAWYPAQTAGANEFIIALPRTGTLAAQNTLDTPATITLESLDGVSSALPGTPLDTSHVFVPIHPRITNSSEINLERKGVSEKQIAPGVYRVRTGGGVAFSVIFSDAQGIASYNLPSGGINPDGITVNILQ